MNWSASVSDEEMKRRAAGRAHYNSVRKFRAWDRRRQVYDAYVAFLGRISPWSKGWGFQKHAARLFHVSEATISRDMRRIRCGDWSL